MHTLVHRRHRNLPGLFEGRSTRVYDVVARRFVRRFYRRIAEDIAATAPHGGALLDVGTGPGVLLAEIAERRPDLELAGIDLSADMVTTATRNLGTRATVRVADVTALPYPDRSFDLVVSSLSLHHWDHPEQAVPELARVLRPGGRLCIYDFPFAPFDALAGLGSAVPERTRFRTGVPLLPRCVRYVVAVSTDPGA